MTCFISNSFYYNYKKKCSLDVPTLYTADPAAAEAANTTPPRVGLPVIPSI